MAKERIQARVDAPRKREVDAYSEEHDISQAEAVRRLVGRGIDYESGKLSTADPEEGGREAPPTIVEHIASPLTLWAALLSLALAAVMLGFAWAAVGGLTTVVLFGSVAAAFVVLGGILVWSAAIAQVSLGRPVTGLLRAARLRGSR